MERKFGLINTFQMSSVALLVVYILLPNVNAVIGYVLCALVHHTCMVVFYYFAPRRPCAALSAAGLFVVYSYSELYLYDFGVYVCASDFVQFIIVEVYALQLLVWQRHYNVHVTEC